jgi:coproporphyrinogen III oxidase
MWWIFFYDRGTRLGSTTGSNTEAIRMSLPPEVRLL